MVFSYACTKYNKKMMKTYNIYSGASEKGLPPFESPILLIHEPLRSGHFQTPWSGHLQGPLRIYSHTFLSPYVFTAIHFLPPKTHIWLCPLLPHSHYTSLTVIIDVAPASARYIKEDNLPREDKWLCPLFGGSTVYHILVTSCMENPPRKRHNNYGL